MSPASQRLNVRYRIIWEGRWHVGSGFGSARADRLVRRYRDGEGRLHPYVPGSQFKGVLRHRCEEIAGTLALPVISPNLTAGEGAAPELLDNFRPATTSDLLIDRLFGSRYQGDCLFVDDARPEGKTPSPVGLMGRTAIDRVTGTAAENRLFVTEVSEGACSPLTGRLQARHPAGVLTCGGEGEFPLEYALLLAGLLHIEYLGGGKSAGLGRCRIEPIGDPVWNGRNLSVEHALAQLGEEDWPTLISLYREENRP